MNFIKKIADGQNL